MILSDYKHVTKWANDPHGNSTQIHPIKYGLSTEWVTIDIRLFSGSTLRFNTADKSWKLKQIL